MAIWKEAFKNHKRRFQHRNSRNRPAQFELVERPKFHTLIRNINAAVRDCEGRLQCQTFKCNFHEHLGVTMVVAYRPPLF